MPICYCFVCTKLPMFVPLQHDHYACNVSVHSVGSCASPLISSQGLGDVKLSGVPGVMHGILGRDRQPITGTGQVSGQSVWDMARQGATKRPNSIICSLIRCLPLSSAWAWGGNSHWFYVNIRAGGFPQCLQVHPTQQPELYISHSVNMMEGFWAFDSFVFGTGVTKCNSFRW